MTDDPVWTRDEPASPCVRVCQLHPATGYCIGCLRTGDEIAAWPRLGDAARRALLAALPDRAGAHAVRRGGRRARTG